MSSSKKRNIMDLLPAYVKRKERKRLRSQITSVDVNSDEGRKDTPLNTIHEEKTQPFPERGSQKHLQRILAYVYCHKQALGDPEYPIVNRPERWPASSSAQAIRRRTTTATDPSSIPKDTTWAAYLARLLLILSLSGQSSFIFDHHHRPSYDQLRIQLLEERKRYETLAQKYATMKDRFKRFQQHVETKRDQYIRAGEQLQQQFQRQQQRQRPVVDRGNDCHSTPRNVDDSSAISSSRQPRSTVVACQHLAKTPQSSTPSESLEVRRKPNPRRVTTSPARILPQLPTPKTTDQTNGDHTMDRKLDATSNRLCINTAREEASHHPPSTVQVSTTTPVHRESMPNPFRTNEGLRPDHVPERTVSSIESIATNPLPAWVVGFQQEQSRNQQLQQEPESPSRRPALQVPQDDDSQTIVPPLPMNRYPLVSIPPTATSLSHSSDQSKLTVPYPTKRIEIPLPRDYSPPNSTANTIPPTRRTNQFDESRSNLHPFPFPASPRQIQKDMVPKVGSGWMSTEPYVSAGQQQFERQQQLPVVCRENERPSISPKIGDSSATSSSHQSRNTIVTIPDVAKTPQSTTPSKPPEAWCIPAPRRVTASPARLLQHLPTSKAADQTNGGHPIDTRWHGTSNRLSVDTARKEESHHPPSTTTSVYRKSVPNAFKITRGLQPDPVPEPTISSIPSIAASPLPTWEVGFQEEQSKQQQQPVSPSRCPALHVPQDDSQTIIPLLPMNRHPLPSLPPTAPASSSFSSGQSNQNRPDPTKGMAVPARRVGSPPNSTIGIRNVLLSNKLGESRPNHPLSVVAVPLHIQKDPTPKVGSGWMSTRPAKAFVGEVDNTKHPSTSTVPPTKVPTCQTFKPQGIAHRLRAKKPIQQDDFLDSPSQKSKEQPFLEVVRNKKERDRLQRYECLECGRFIEAICDLDPQGLYDRHALICNSRHRARFTPPQTPEDFWELSFIDERDAKRRRIAEAEKSSSPSLENNHSVSRKDKDKP